MSQATIHESSAGGAVIRHKRRGAEICLVLRHRHRQSEYSLPKGHINKEENPNEAALREVREETGCLAKITAVLGTITYQFKKKGLQALVHKDVTFFLMSIEGASCGVLDTEEVAGVKWASFDEAIRIVSYENERQIIRKAKQVVEGPNSDLRITP